MPEMLKWLIEVVESFGYIGIFIMTFLESTFLPIPSEITMIPAGYLVAKGEMHMGMVLFAGITGTVGGAFVNYFIARRFGRPLIQKYQKYFLLNDKRIAKIDAFFQKHGEISTLSGRLLPGLRHFISFPAGFSGMKIHKFCFYTAIGGGIWTTVLAYGGYYLGDNEAMVEQYTGWIVVAATVVVVLAVVGYMAVLNRINAKKQKSKKA
jgi:membrane protein DedA with SNARE-associated domain